MVPLGPWDKPVLLGLREARDLLGQQDPWATQDDLDRRDHLARLEIVEQLEELVHQDQLDHLVRLGKRAHPVNRAILETQGHQDLLEIQVLQVPPDRLDSSDSRVQMVTLDQSEQRDLQEPRVHRDLVEAVVNLDL